MKPMIKKTICNIAVVLFGFLLFVPMLQGDDTVDEAATEREQLRLQVRRMINAGIPNDEAEGLVRMMNTYRFSHQQMVRAGQVVIDAEKEGLPVGPVINKAREGIAKQAPDEAIVNAMEKMRSRYAFAYRQAEKVTDDRKQVRRIGKSIVNGLQAGLRVEDADQIMNTVRQRTMQMTRSETEEMTGESFSLAKTMARLGVSSAAITDITCEALRNNYSAQTMRQLQNRFRVDAMNTPPSVVADQYRYSIQNRVMANELGRHNQGGDSGAGISNGPGHDRDSGRSKGARVPGSPGAGGSGSGGLSGSPGAGGSGSGGSGSDGSSGGSGSSGSGSGGSSGGSGSSGSGPGGSSGGGTGGSKSG